jgi:hypothetical protein
MTEVIFNPNRIELEPWGSLTPVASIPTVFIEQDFAGFGGHLRYTIYPTGETLVQQPFYRREWKLTQWKDTRDAFFKQVPPDTLILTVSRKRVGTASQAIGFDGFER